MAPLLRKREDCLPYLNTSIDRNHSAVVGTDNYHDEDKHALLYIVCTLLFYSLGMIVGIVSYIKREKQDIEQDRMFNEFLTSFRGNTEEIHYRQLKVQETVERLAEIERIGGFSDNSYSGFDSRRPSSGGSLGDKANLLKFAHLSLLRAPVVVVTNMSSEVDSNEQVGDTESTDPFQDRRLSEMVAKIFDNENEEITKQTTVHYEDSKSQNDIETAFIDYAREPTNKELYKETMQNINESENNSAVRSNEVLQTGHECKYNFVQDNALHQNIKTTVGKSRETVFGVTVPQENTEIEVEKTISNETEFGADTEYEDTKFRWSVTSV